MSADDKYINVHPDLIGKIIASYISHHNVAPEQIPDLINSVHRTIDGLGKPAEPQGALTPAVPIRRSVQRDAVVCLECGWKGKMLRRHLSTRHGLTGEQYLKRWSLPSDHPLTAPTYSEQRSTLAIQLGLGRGGRQTAAAPVSEAAHRRRGRPWKGSHADLSEVERRLSEFYSPAEIQTWLYSKHRLLGQKRAIDLIHEGRTAEILSVIESLDESTYT
jgi:predicted transcriptional regulator